MNEDNVIVTGKLMKIGSLSKNFRIYDEVYTKPCPTQLPVQDPFMIEVERKHLNLSMYLFPRQYGRNMTMIENMIHHRHGQYFGNYIIKSNKESLLNEYRKFIKESKYKRIRLRDRSISIPRIQCTKSNRNNIKYDS